MDVRIPFALDKKTGVMVEVGNVERGRQCGCLCPSCRQGVVARHGEVNAWHFSHDKNAIDKPVKECEISFDSCCRQYALELLLKGEITRMTTPDFKITIDTEIWPTYTASECVTQSRILDDVIIESCSSYDAKIIINDFNLYLFLNYKNRNQPLIPNDGKSGLLEIDIGVVKNKFYEQKSTPGLLKRLLKDLIENDTDNKNWLYHPSEEKARKNLHDKIEKSKLERAPAIKEPVITRNSTFSIFKCGQKTERNGKFTCIMCHIDWHGHEFTDIYCPKCKEYLYVRFIPDNQ